MIAKVLLLTFMAGFAMAYEYEDSQLVENEGRFLYFNSSSTATSLTVLGAIILMGVIIYLVYVGGLLSPVGGAGFSNNRNDYYNQQYDPYNQARSASDGFGMNMNVVQWISMLQEVYQKFDYNDLECQKRLICEVMQEPQYFGQISKGLTSGMQFARYLEVLNLPDDFREVLDEYVDASERSVGQKACEEVFDCPYSLKDSMKRNFYGNAL